MKWLRLRLNEKQINAFLFVTQGVGAVFVGVFLAAYLVGLPTTDVFHSEPAFRIPLTVLGAVLLIMVLSASVLAVLSKKD
jgi:F0F1-type ATP synthase assembly protein I